jgi:recombination protein RecA
VAKKKKLRVVPGAADERLQKIEALVQKTEKLFGAGSIGTLRGKFARRQTESVGVISTGSVGLDYALGVGGLPRGRIIEIYGPAASGKTTAALHIIAECQKQGGLAGFVDAEHAVDPPYASRLGVDLETLLFSQPDSGEQALDITETLVASGEVDLIVVDSVAALVPQAELEGAMGDQQMGLQARMMSKAMRKLTSMVSRTGCTVIFINQLRHKIGVTFGSPEVTSGGNALKYYCSVRLDVRRIGSIKKTANDTEIMGNRVRVKVVKNKVAPPFRTAEFDIVFGQGIDWAAELVDYGIACDELTKAGAWYRVDGENFAQGRAKAIKHVRETPELSERLRKKIKSYLETS